MQGISATFTYAVRYDIEAVCRTPLRTGSVEGDTETVLKNRNGIAFVQGTSLAGAMRSWLRESKYQSFEEKLFGNQLSNGQLIISDGLFAEEAVKKVRPRLRINGALGSADRGGKFDTAHIETGSVFHFTITWLGDFSKQEGNDAKDEADELTVIEAMLSAIQSGEVLFGGQKTNGFGQVNLTVKKRSYQMKNPEDRAAWLADSNDGKLLSLSDNLPGNQVVFTIKGRLDSLLVKEAAAEQMKEGSITENIKENGIVVIPGSSIKGAIRGRIAAIVNLMGLDYRLHEEMFGRGAEKGKDEDSGKPGSIYFPDVRLFNVQERKISRIRVNRFTGGVMRGGLFSEEPVCGDVEIKVFAPDRPETCGLLLYAFRDLGLGLYGIGSGGSIGRGYLSDVEIVATTPVGDMLCLRFDENRQCKAEGSVGLLQKWLESLEGARI